MTRAALALLLALLWAFPLLLGFLAGWALQRGRTRVGLGLLALGGLSGLARPLGGLALLAGLALGYFSRRPSSRATPPGRARR